jgi:hypothetical protein
VRCHPEALRPALRRGIRRLAWTFVAVSALPLALTSAEPPAPFLWPNGAKAAVVLSYDDGVDVDLDNVAPDLEAAGLRGTFFVPGHSESLAKRLPEWRALAARGHEIGNHAIFHPCLRTVPQGGRDWVRPEYALESYSPPSLPGRADRRGPDRRGRARPRPDARPELDGPGRHGRADDCLR